ncbi:hypothetical protein AVEN_197437-1 [Araneus ventricosus]|uniref:Uncharacterized protein n=1 Tax=Araneus ventricosus TaxID=182803 RepID=A0A4Y2IBU1_ARAVE|nr:hypothetical protein AVEN_197437-1 [Araneus ventricosus]
MNENPEKTLPVPQKGKKKEKLQTKEPADPRLSAILGKATELLSQLGIDDDNCEKVMGFIFEAFGLRNCPVIREGRTKHKPPSSKKKAKAKNLRRSKTADNPQGENSKSSEEQPESTPLNFASAAQKGASKVQDPPVSTTVQSTKRAPPGRTNLSKAKKSWMILAHPREDKIHPREESGVNTSTQMLRLLEKNISLGNGEDRGEMDNSLRLSPSCNKAYGTNTNDRSSGSPAEKETNRTGWSHPLRPQPHLRLHPSHHNKPATDLPDETLVKKFTKQTD